MRNGAVLGVLALLAAAGLSGAPADEKGKAKTGVVMVPFGKTSDGKNVELYVLKNRNGMTAKIMTLGATITELILEALRHEDGPLAGACGRAASFLRGWWGEPPGLPFAPQQ